jgi:hypothetical protein
MSELTLPPTCNTELPAHLSIPCSSPVKTARKPTTGIVLIAAGHPDYGHRAYNLLISLKHQSPEIPVAVITMGSALKGLDRHQRARFDLIIDADPALADGTNSKGQKVKNYFQLKLNLYTLSPFKRTLYLDADVIWAKRAPVSEYLMTLEDVPFTMINEGHSPMLGEFKGNPKYTHWAKREDIAQAYCDVPGFLDSRLYQLRSELIWFVRNKENAKFFRTALQVLKEMKVSPERLGGGIPDELCFNIAAAICQHYPHEEKYCPIFWHYVHGRPESGKRTVLLNKFYAVSMGGNAVPDDVRSLYNGLADFHAKAQGIQPWKSKPENDKKAGLRNRAVI